MTVVWVNGDLFDSAEARVSVFDHALLTGDGVFETLRVYGGVPFAVRRHLERLAVSAAGLGLRSLPAYAVADAMNEVIDANQMVDGRLRLTLTGGPAPLGSERGDTQPTFIVAGGGLPAWPVTADVVVVPWPRNERGALAGLKTVSYGENVVALSYAAERGAGEAIFANLVGNLCEGTGSNVFVARGGRLFTPPLSSGCLAGVTRDVVMEVVEVTELDMAVGDLATADEAFLTSSTREVQAIGTVDGQPLVGAPGPLTKAAAAAFRDLVARDLNP